MAWCKKKKKQSVKSFSNCQLFPSQIWSLVFKVSFNYRVNWLHSFVWVASFAFKQNRANISLHFCSSVVQVNELCRNRQFPRIPNSWHFQFTFALSGGWFSWTNSLGSTELTLNIRLDSNENWSRAYLLVFISSCTFAKLQLKIDPMTSIPSCSFPSINNNCTEF